MCQFLESIKLKDGEIFHIDWHQKRVNETFQTVWQSTKAFQLSRIIQSENIPQKGLFKIRMVYHKTIFIIEIQPYQKRKIQTIELVSTNKDYPLKSTERNFLQQAVQQSDADEVIFCKDGMITDSSYANVVFFDGQDWFTPSTYLLNGTTRQRLLYENKIKEKPINQSEIFEFKKLGFINALNDLGEQVIDLNTL